MPETLMIIYISSSLEWKGFYLPNGITVTAKSREEVELKLSEHLNQNLEKSNLVYGKELIADQENQKILTVLGLLD